MSIRTITAFLSQVSRGAIGGWLAERKKATLRARVMALPITPSYPFDVEAKLIRTLGIEPSVMLDIGANTGIYSAILEDQVGSENLYLFEPLPHLHAHLKHRFRDAHVFDFALSDEEGTQNIRVPYIAGKRFDTRATFNEHTEPNQTGFDEIEVRFFPLDRVVERFDFDAIGFVKIDVEGHELEVIRGGSETFTRFKPLILMEIEARHHSFPITRIFSEVEGLGYRGFYVKPEAFELLEIKEFDSERDQNPSDLEARNFTRYLNNFFLVHHSSAEDFVARATAFLESERH